MSLAGAGADARRIRRRLRQVFDYLHDLSKQLNYLKPAINRAYFFPGFRRCLPQLTPGSEGFTDLRTLPQQEGGGIERVTFTYTLKGAGRARCWSAPGPPASSACGKSSSTWGLRFRL